MRDAFSTVAPMSEARAAFAAGDWSAALAAAARAVARAPTSTETLLLAVDSALRADALATAVPWLETLLRLHPDRAQLRQLLSTALHDLGTRQLGAGDQRAALSTFARALAARPDDPRALFDHARACVATGQVDAALASLRHLLLLAPDHAAANALLAQARAAAEAGASGSRTLEAPPRARGDAGTGGA